MPKHSQEALTLATHIAGVLKVSTFMGEIISTVPEVLFVTIGIIIYFATRKTMEAPPFEGLSKK